MGERLRSDPFLEQRLNELGTQIQILTVDSLWILCEKGTFGMDLGLSGC